MSKKTPGNDEVQGEGDYNAARRYDKAVEEFAHSGKVEPAARKAAPDTPAQADEMKRAEEAGKSHAKGEDPGVDGAGSRTPGKAGG